MLLRYIVLEKNVVLILLLKFFLKLFINILLI